MKRVYLMKRLPLAKNYYAICLFGIVFTLRPLSATELNHVLLFFKYRDWEQAYFHIRFEQEAYHHQGDLDYLNHRRHYRYT